MQERAEKRKAAKIGGVYPGHFKNTADYQTVVMPPPSKVIIAMQQHIGTPCIPTVKKGDTVTVGQVIGDNTALICAPVHSSVSGTVSTITTVVLPNGAKCEAVEIESDGLMTPYSELHPHPVQTAEGLINAARESGLVGLGGAGFPTHVKLSPKEGAYLDTLIVNGAECEPFITSDYRECIEYPYDIMDGIYLIKTIMGLKNVIIGIEDNKPEAIKILQNITQDIKNTDDTVKFLTLKSIYPQGAEKVLIYTATGRKLPPDRLPADIGCIVMNITSISFLYRYIRTGMPLVTKRLTIDGSAMAKPMNVEVPIGSSIQDVIAFCGGYSCTPEKLITGGPMMGFAVPDDTLPVLKQNNAILAFDAKDSAVPESTPCIRCGRCTNVCPMRLQPAAIETVLKMRDDISLEQLGARYCIECGSCSFICPAKRQLVQSMRIAKKKIRKAGNK